VRDGSSFDLLQSAFESIIDRVITKQRTERAWADWRIFRKCL